jgi:hypothetical protein
MEDIQDTAEITSGAAEKNRKPLGGKAYGSIGHLPGSRMGPPIIIATRGKRASPRSPRAINTTM